MIVKRDIVRKIISLTDSFLVPPTFFLQSFWYLYYEANEGEPDSGCFLSQEY